MGGGTGGRTEKKVEKMKAVKKKAALEIDIEGKTTNHLINPPTD